MVSVRGGRGAGAVEPRATIYLDLWDGIGGGGGVIRLALCHIRQEVPRGIPRLSLSLHGKVFTDQFSKCMDGTPAFIHANTPHQGRLTA